MGDQVADYGALSHLVANIGALAAAAAAIILSFKGRQSWEPSEEDVPKGPVKVVGALTAICVGLLFVSSITHPKETPFFAIAIGCAIALLTSFLAYVVLITAFTFERERVVNGRPLIDKVIGGFWLTPEAIEVRKEHADARNIQKLFRRAAYETRDVWPDGARGLSKCAFLLAYFIIIVSGCVALASVAILIDHAIAPAS